MKQEDDIRRAVETMRKGGVILYPTDTVWGIGCDATNAEAVAKVYKIKQRDDLTAMPGFSAMSATFPKWRGTLWKWQ